MPCKPNYMEVATEVSSLLLKSLKKSTLLTMVSTILPVSSAIWQITFCLYLSEAMAWKTFVFHPQIA
jgi:hypothetical protein